MKTSKRAPFCHIVIPAPDLEKAKSFYEEIFAWHVEPNVPGEKYWFFESGNVGGAFDGTRAPATAVTLILKVDDMEETLKRVTDKGGTVIRESSRIGEATAGYDAYFLDSNGNEIGLYSEG